MTRATKLAKRITLLDNCFSSRTGLYTIEKLQDVIEDQHGDRPSRRTIQNNITQIKETIESNLSEKYDIAELIIFEKGLYDGYKKAFRYSRPEFSLGNNLLSKSDQEQLKETLAILRRYQDREGFDWLEELFPRIETAFNLEIEGGENLISY